MAVYRADTDLEFLAECENEDLDVLVDYLTKGKDGTLRFNEELTPKESYKKNNPNHKAYWQDIAAELQTWGGNTFANLARGDEGPLYKTVLVDVAKKMKVNFNPESQVELIEMNLLMKVLTDSMENMTSEQLKEIVETTGLKTTNFTPQAVVAALQIAIRKTGFWAMNKLALIVANAVAKMVLGRGLMVATNAALTATVARTCAIFAGPIGWAITGLWTLVDLAGPAYRVTMPSVIHVAYMRAKVAYKDKKES
jgi:uncharacterized protein YaaW (UPF0174 family)